MKNTMPANAHLASPWCGIFYFVTNATDFHFSNAQGTRPCTHAHTQIHTDTHMLVCSTNHDCICVWAYERLEWVSDFQRHAREFPLACISTIQYFFVQVNWLLRFFLWMYGPVILRAFTCLEKRTETGWFSNVLGVVGFISIFQH